MEEYELAIKMAQDLLRNHIDPKYVYHNYDHTLNVVKAAHIIGFHSKLSKKDLDLLIMAAWFHDVGYCSGHLSHEESSVKIASRILSTVDFSREDIDKISLAILSTSMPQNPTTDIAKCLCDADLYHLSQPDYKMTCGLLRQELDIVNGTAYTDEQWCEENKNFMSS